MIKVGSRRCIWNNAWPADCRTSISEGLFELGNDLLTFFF